jgi:glycosyltransferase involved in cell wall biosynthesis
VTEQIDVSVVMSVYNGAEHLRGSLDSILSQDGVSLELIVVNDGSTDKTPQILDEYFGRDSRVRIIHQENQGLTAALVRGGSTARGCYIARQDAGDVSMPGRLNKQLACIKERPDASLVSCGTRFVGPADEFLYDVTRNPRGATERLLTLDPAVIEGPSSHPSTMFPRAAYERVGGYRSAFYFGQDLDLWIRLAEQGEHIILPEMLYQAAVTVQSISGRYRREQIETTRIILESARLRRNGLSEQPALSRAESIKPVKKRGSSRLARARALYFIGACLKRRNDPQATIYLKEALRIYPLHLRSAVRLLFG